MSRLHRQKLRQRARDVHPQFARTAEAGKVASTDESQTVTPAKASRAKRSKRRAASSSKAKAKAKRKATR